MIKSSGLLAEDKIIYTGHCRLRGVSFSEDIGTSSTITVYNGLTAGGGVTTIVAHGRAAGGLTTTGQGACNFVIKFSEEDNLDCETGLFADMSSTTGDYIIYYETL